jgi:2',3'-cyclic-nucleotide 2'-phosphodiesterase (5'-nucleotidase family)
MRLLAAHQIPAVASNLSHPDGTPVFARDRLLTLAGVRIGIFGIVVPQPDDAAAWQAWPVRVDDPLATARTEIASLRQRGARVVVALIHVGSNEAARQLLAAAPGVDFAVQGHTRMQTETVDTVGAARRVEALGLGKLVGRLDVHVVEDARAAAGPAQNASPTLQPSPARPLRFTDRGDRAALRSILADHQRQLSDLAKRASEDHTNQLESYYRSRREGLTAAMAHERELLSRLPRSISGSWFENRLVPLDDSIPDHPAVALLVAAYDAESAGRAAAGLPVGVEWRRRDAARPGPRSSPRLPAAAKSPAAPP